MKTEQRKLREIKATQKSVRTAVIALALGDAVVGGTMFMVPMEHAPFRDAFGGMSYPMTALGIGLVTGLVIGIVALLAGVLALVFIGQEVRKAQDDYDDACELVATRTRW
jgi:hypothetical protein